MERKIGEVFKRNGEWYQCIKVDPIINADDTINYCEGCSISASECDNFNCIDDQRSDKELVIFKKLEKVGEPFERNGYMYQEYKTHTYPLLMSGGAKIPTSNGFAVIIKNKDDMEEGNNSNLSNTEKIGKNLKPFDLEAAKAGKPVCTRDGRKARIVCFDAKGDYPIIALIDNTTQETDVHYTLSGRAHVYTESEYDLMILPEKKTGWVNIYKGDDIRVAIISNAYNTKEKALTKIDEVLAATYITTRKIEWEE